MHKAGHNYHKSGVITPILIIRPTVDPHKGLVTNYGEGGHVKFYPYEKRGGGQKKF